MLSPVQPNKNRTLASMTFTKSGGLMRRCQNNASLSGVFLPNIRYMTLGVAFTNASIKGCCKPLGVVAGASAINKLTFLFKSEFTERPANACAVP